jgi:putative PIG3 family NAD(P)H quinone oxidoreductase
MCPSQAVGRNLMPDLKAGLMTAVAVEGDGRAAESLRPAKRPRPEPGPGEILVKVRAAGVNRADLLQRRGAYPPPPGAPDILGLEAAGEVAAAEAGGRWRVGDRVAVLLGGGGYAEYVSVDARHALPVPADLEWAEAAALPETLFTVWANVFETGSLRPGETLMVHGATSGIGVSAILMGKLWGARVIGTARGAAKADAARRLGADVAVDSTAGDWLEAVRDAGGADVILDMVGGDYVQRNLHALKPEGRLVNIAYQAGAKMELDLRPVMTKRLTITGSTLRGRPADEKARLAEAVERHVWPWVLDGRLRLPVDTAYPLAEAAAAHARLESGEHLGKIVLTL